MYHLFYILVAIVALSICGARVVAHPRPTPLNTFSRRADMKTTPMHYSGIVEGHEVELNGTVSDIQSQLHTLYPSYTPPSFPPSLAPRTNTPKPKTKIPPPPSNPNFNTTCCNSAAKDYAGIDAPSAKDRIDRMRSLVGKCGVVGGMCTQVTCWKLKGVEGAKVGFCSDGKDSVEVDCNQLVEAALSIYTGCTVDIEEKNEVCGIAKWIGGNGTANGTAEVDWHVDLGMGNCN